SILNSRRPPRDLSGTCIALSRSRGALRAAGGRMRIPRVQSLRVLVSVVLLLTVASSRPTTVGAQSWLTKVDPLLQARAGSPGRSRVILRGVSAQAVSTLAPTLPWIGVRVGRR